MAGVVTALDRDCRRAIIVGCGAIAASACLIGGVARSWKQSAAFAVVGLASWSIAAVTLWRARRLLAEELGAGARLGLATYVTLLRGLLVSVTAGFALLPAVSSWRWGPGGLYGAAALLDRGDGTLARRRGQVTALGAHLDGAMDALGLLAAPLVAVAWRRLPPWYLVLGAAYYLYQGGISARRRLSLPVHPERVVRRPETRLFAGLQMVLVAAALPPVLPLSVTTPAATILMLPTLAFFVRDWRLVTRGATPR